MGRKHVKPKGTKRGFHMDSDPHILSVKDNTINILDCPSTDFSPVENLCVLQTSRSYTSSIRRNEPKIQQTTVSSLKQT